MVNALKRYDLLCQKVRNLEEVLEDVNPKLYQNYYKEDCIQCINRTVFFNGMSDHLLNVLASKMQRISVPKGTFLARQGEFMDLFYIVSSGKIRRWTEIQNRIHIVKTYDKYSLGLLHIFDRYAGIREENRLRFNAECLNEVVLYQLTSDDFQAILRQYPETAGIVIRNLAFTLREKARELTLETPLCEQKYHTGFSYISVILTASIESFHRSACDSWRIKSITGHSGRIFPSMHIQIPLRVGYMLGLKKIRAMLDDVDLPDTQQSSQYRMAFCFIPGIVMCPVSSIIDARTVNYVSKEPLRTRWRRGYNLRTVREMMFAMGLNQMSDFFAERIGPRVTHNPNLQSIVGSFTAGLVTGYLSHVTHSLATGKLLHPAMSYRQSWKNMWIATYNQLNNESRISSSNMAVSYKRVISQALTLLCPIGVMRRSIQIAGSFVIINGGLYGLRNQTLL